MRHAVLGNRTPGRNCLQESSPVRLAEEDGIDPASLIRGLFHPANPLRQPLKLPGIAIRPLGDLPGGQPVLPINHTWLTLMLKRVVRHQMGLAIIKANCSQPVTSGNRWRDFATILASAAVRP